LMRAWTFLNSEHQEFLDLVPAQQWRGADAWYEGTADAVYQSLDIIEGYAPEHVLLLAGDHVYTMDYGTILATHVRSDADFTVACKPVPASEATEFGVMQVDNSGRITGFEEKPEMPKTLPDDPSRALISMGVYVVSYEFLRKQLIRDAADKDSNHDFGKDIIPHILATGCHVQAHNFVSPTGGEAYWRDVGTIDAYFQANLEQLSATPSIDLHDPTWPILTDQPQLPPAHLRGDASNNRVGNSLVSGGCIVEPATVTDSVLFSNVTVESKCSLNRVLALPGCRIGAGSRLSNVILDNQCIVPEGTIIGEDTERDLARYPRTPEGVTILNRRLLGQGTYYIPGVVPHELSDSS